MAKSTLLIAFLNWYNFFYELVLRWRWKSASFCNTTPNKHLVNSIKLITSPLDKTSDLSIFIKRKFEAISINEFDDV